MHISHGTRIKNINPTNGYGYATDRMIDSLHKLGHVVNQNDPDADVEIWFDQPHHWKIRPGQYTIGYHPWESTQLKPGWVEIMNKCDEIWTPSPLIAEWYRKDGVTIPVHVYEHGVDPVWAPVERKVEDKIRFLHIGGEAVRKGARETMQAFRLAFPTRDDVELTLKMIAPGWNIPTIGRTTLVNRTLGLNELVALYHEHHVFVYPSWGEGFGLTPLQAAATGMPTITVSNWAPYAHHLDTLLNVPAELSDHPWEDVHPGKMFKPNLDVLVDKMRLAADNYQFFSDYAAWKVPSLKKEYDWISLTNDAFSRLEKRLENS